MVEVWILILAVLIAVFFISQRKQAEIARQAIAEYCKKNNIQLLSVALNSRHFQWSGPGAPYLKADYAFEFSSNGTNHYRANLEMKGQHPSKFEVPPYTVV